MIKQFNIQDAVSYAVQNWNKRNPRFYNFDDLGGDCTNFISQCLLAGGAVMNYNPIYGWYYNHLNDRAPAFTGVEEFYQFLTTNTILGPAAQVIQIEKAQIGDIIQLNQRDKGYNHTSIITQKDDNTLYLTAHTTDVLHKPLSAYPYKSIRVLHVSGIYI